LKILASNFVRLFSRVLSINVLILSEIHLRIRNWHWLKVGRHANFIYTVGKVISAKNSTLTARTLLNKRTKCGPEIFRR